eukprot:TRINITY_DN2584_c0_g1_i1.p1 TRINITY_DN2584_c0_g1~~TRINITY_DN2584_c0_g1_i1.p1  ORF type:complete len:286 (-),score=74.79 TRINITY_DN2584_c0_g1_i1:572-1396(-)
MAIVEYSVKGRVAFVTLNRPERFNAINAETPRLLREAIERANQDQNVSVIVLSGNGKAFCSGYDLKDFAEAPRPCLGSQMMPWDPLKDYSFMSACTRDFMSIWHSLKPVITKIQGYAVAGGSDIALCSDIIIMAEDAKIGYPPARCWGCPTTFMWVYRVGLDKAKRMLLTGDLIDGKEAAQIGLVTKCVKPEELDAEVQRWVDRISSVPQNQLMMQKIVINKAFEGMGLPVTQAMATIFDGIARHTPEGVEFKKLSEEHGFKEAVRRRDNPSKL